MVERTRPRSRSPTPTPPFPPLPPDTSASEGSKLDDSANTDTADVSPNNNTVAASDVASALVTLEDFFSAAFNDATTSSSSSGRVLPGHQRRLVDGFMCPLDSGGGSPSWKNRLTALESPNPHKQTVALNELRDWLTYLTLDTVRGIPSERLTAALVDIIAGRPSSSTAGGSTTRRRRRRHSVRDEEEEEEEGSGDDGWTDVSCWEDQTQEQSAGASNSEATQKREELVVQMSPSASSSEEDDEADEDDDDEGDNDELGPVEEEEEEVVVIEDGSSATTRRLAAADCLQHLLECNPTATRFFVGSDGVNVLCEQLSRVEYIDLAEKIVACLQTLASEIPMRLMTAGAVEVLLGILDFFPLCVQRSIVVTVASVLSQLGTKAHHQAHVQPCLPQLAALVDRPDGGDDQLLRWGAMALRRVAENVGRHDDDAEFVAQVMDALAAVGTHTALLARLRSLIPDKPSTTPGAGGVVTSNSYWMALDALYILTMCTFYSERMTAELLDGDVVSVLHEYLQFQATLGQDPALTTYVLAFSYSILPTLQLAPAEKKEHDEDTSLLQPPGARTVIQLDSSRVELLLQGGHTQRITSMCQTLLSMLLEAVCAPESRDAAQPLFLLYCLALGSLAEQAPRNHPLRPMVLQQLSSPRFIEFLALKLEDPKSSCTATLTCLLIAGALLRLDATAVVVTGFCRHGVLKHVLKRTDRDASPAAATAGRQQQGVGGTVGKQQKLPVADLEQRETELWESLLWQFERCRDVAGSSGVFMNVSALIQWAAYNIALQCGRTDQMKAIAEQKRKDILRLTQTLVGASTGEPAMKKTASTEKEAATALRALRTYVTERCHGGDGISVFEMFQYGGVDALCQYLLGGTIQCPEPAAAPSSSPRDGSPSSQPPSSCVDRLFPSLVQQSPSMEKETERLLLFIRHMCSLDPDHAPKSEQAAWPLTGVFPMALDVRPLLLLSRLLVQCIDHCATRFPVERLTAIHPEEMTLTASRRGGGGTGIKTTTETTSLGTLPRHLQPPPYENHYFGNPNGPIHAQQPAEIRTVLTDAAAKMGRVTPQRCPPQSLFDFLGTELKLSANVTVRDPTSCDIGFGSAQCDDAIDQSRADALTQMKSRATTTWRSSSSSEERVPAAVADLGHVDIRRPGDRDGLSAAAAPAEAADGKETPGVMLMLQLCVDVRTPAAALQQGLVRHVEKQVRWLQSRMQQADGDKQEPETDMEDKIRIRGASVDETESSSVASDRTLSVTVGGHTVPPHMTIAEALCRYAGCVLAPRWAVQQQQLSTEPQTKAPECPKRRDGVPKPLRDGTWLLFGRKARYLVLSPEEEQNRSIHVAVAADGTESPKTKSSSSIRVQKNRNSQPLWDVEQTITMNLQAGVESPDTIQPDLERYERLRDLYVGEAGAPVCAAPTSDCVGVFPPLPEGTTFDDSVTCLTASLPDGTRLVSVGELLAHLHLRKCYQNVGLSTPPNFDALCAVATTEKAPRSSPTTSLRRFVAATRQFDFVRSPILCNSVSPQYSHAALYARLLQDIGQIVSVPDEPDAPMRILPPAAPRVVREAMETLRGWHDQRGAKSSSLCDTIIQAGIPSTSSTPVDLPPRAWTRPISSSAITEASSSVRFATRAAHRHPRRTEMEEEDEDDEEENEGESEDSHDQETETDNSRHDDHETDDTDEEDEEETSSDDDPSRASNSPPPPSPQMEPLYQKGGHVVDVFDGDDKVAALVQVTLLVFHLIDDLIASNRSLFAQRPAQFLTDVRPCEDQPSPLFFPTAAQLHAAQLSRALTANIRRQLLDPIAVASARIPPWIHALPAVAPSLVALNARKLLHTSTTRGVLMGISEFAERLRRDVEVLGALQPAATSARRGATIVQIPFFPHGRHRAVTTTTAADDILYTALGHAAADDEALLPHDASESGWDRPDPTLVAIAQSVYRLGDGNRRRQWRRGVELRQLLGRQRTKIRLLRSQILDSAAKVLDFFHVNAAAATLPAMMEVEYIDEEGTGSGPTLEFYAEVIDQLVAAETPRLFRETDGPKTHGWYSFPQPHRVDPARVCPGSLQRPGKQKIPKSAGGDSVLPPSLPLEDRLFTRFKLLGQLYAKALIDGRLIDLPLHPLFWKLVISPVHQWASLADEASLADVDPQLCQHLRQLRDLKRDALDQLALTFILPGSSQPEIPLVPGGDAIPVTTDNVEFFIRGCCEWTLWRGIALQVWAFRFGIATFLPLHSLRLFSPIELSASVTGCVGATDRDEYWSLRHLQQAIAPDHGYTPDSPVFLQFLEVVSELTKAQRRAFLKFCTGTSILPRGGFLSLRPGMKVVKKGEVSGPSATTSSSSSSSASPSGHDDLLPSVMACTNYIKLPNYSSKCQLRRKLLLALEEGQKAFTLS